MRVFVYDQSFEGLLSVIFDAYTLKCFPSHLCGRGDLHYFAGAHVVATRPEKSGRVFAALCRKLSTEGLHNLFLLWLAEESGGDLLLFRHLCKVLQHGGIAENDPADADALAVRRLARKVARQAEHYAGFVRFQKTRPGFVRSGSDGVIAKELYLAIIEPQHNILPLLQRHFVARLGDQLWAIYDAARHYGLMAEGEDVREIFLDENILHHGGLREELLAEGEEFMQEMWKSYFQSCAVRERVNPSLQKQLMPQRYWKYLTEKQIFRAFQL
ncbi:MAG: TIGR03915 family putative DNA repair protein [Deltaproteobacteria bacterium]|nr:TIGR03915 family putative DNA repair protein [Deltaproteobacteria bacterium]